MIPATSSPTTGGSFTRRQTGGTTRTAASATANFDNGDKDATCTCRYSTAPVFNKNASIAGSPFEETIRFDGRPRLLVYGFPTFSGIVFGHVLRNFSSLPAEVLLIDDAI